MTSFEVRFKFISVENKHKGEIRFSCLLTVAVSAQLHYRYIKKEIKL